MTAQTPLLVDDGGGWPFHPDHDRRFPMRSSNPVPTRALRVLRTKAGLDAHERGMHVVSRGLRDHGFEVIILGLRQSAESVAAVAVQEDVDIVGISSVAGGHLTFVRAVREALRAADADVVIVLGGVIPAEDHEQLHELGVAELYPPGTMVARIADRLRELCGGRRPWQHPSSTEIEEVGP